MLALPPLSPEITTFFEQYGGFDGKFELVGGEVVDGRGGTAGHARLIGDILCALQERLRGSGLETMNGLMGLRIDDATVLYPDTAVYGDRRDLDLPGEAQVFRFPKIVVEVMSPATRDADEGYKLVAYKRIETTTAVLLVDPFDQRIDLHERVAPDEWRHRILPPESGVTLRDPALTLTFAEIFAVD